LDFGLDDAHLNFTIAPALLSLTVSMVYNTVVLGQPRVLCYQYDGESESGLGPIGSAENWRCVVFEKLRRVELVNGSWKTAPNHSRPATCVVNADIDAEDQPERDPQQGH
jgi:hypothetical protein